MSGVVCFGELLVDWVATAPARSLESARAFEKAPGGAPANVAVALARLGVEAAFAGGVAPDPFGNWLRALVRRDGVNVDAAVEVPGTNTRMAFVLVDENGDRRLAAFTTAAVADASYGPELARQIPYRHAAIFHYGGVTLASQPSAGATLEALRLARDAGCLISFDPNIRLALWSSADAARRAITPLLSRADVLKVSDDELELLTGAGSVETGVELLWERDRPALLAVTMGAKGALLRSAHGTLRRDGFQVVVKDTTGAGDAFTAGLLRAVHAAVGAAPALGRRDAVTRMREDTLEAALREACALGALATTRAGAMAALPTDRQLKQFLLGVR
jgi:sugar/nucleoside kinase (ribokinase family)